MKQHILTVLIVLAALTLAACSAATPTSQPPQPPAREGSHPPLILRVEDRQEVLNGFLWMYHDVYFMDPDGDAIAMTYALTSSSLTYPLKLTDDPIEASAEEQKSGARFTWSGKCSQKLELVFAGRIKDTAGNLSEPVPLTMSCKAPQSLDTRPFLVSGLAVVIPISLLLLLGFWLLFRKHPADGLPALRSTVLIFFLFMFLELLHKVFHEGGHSLYLLVRGVPIMLYVHPYTFSGYGLPVSDSNLYNILGSTTVVLVGLLISVPFWKRRSRAILPLVMFVPYIALFEGIYVMGVLGGDFQNLVQSTGLPAVLFLILGALIFCIRIISLLSLFSLAGLDPRNYHALFVLPAAMFLISVLSLLVALLLVPGSPIDRQYFLAGEIVSLASNFIGLWFILGIILAVVYVTLFRKMYPRLPAWLRSATTSMAWKDLCLPASLWAVSMVIGLVIVA